MRNIDLIAKFFNGGTTGHGSNLYIDNDKLIEYSTTLAQRVNGGYILNTTKYSRTTSKIQNWINWKAHDVLARVNGLGFGVYDLTRCLTPDNVTSGNCHLYLSSELVEDYK